MNIKLIIEQEVYNHREYLKWKRKNVTIRGIREAGSYNGGGARFGDGLYTAFLSNKKLAKEFGKVYFVLGAKPKHPKVVPNTSEAEVFQYNEIIIPYLRKHGLEERSSEFYKHTDLKTEMLNNGYDGLVITGREMVNYTPDENEIRYFSNEYQLMQYYAFINNIRL